MSRPDAEQRLEQIGKFERDERKRQQVWRLKDHPNYVHIVLGYDENSKVRYVTAFADPTKTRLRFTDIGDISKAKAEIQKPHHTYTWDVQPEGDRLGYIVSTYGAEPEFSS